MLWSPVSAVERLSQFKPFVTQSTTIPADILLKIREKNRADHASATQRSSTDQPPSMQHQNHRFKNFIAGTETHPEASPRLLNHYVIKSCKPFSSCRAVLYRLDRKEANSFHAQSSVNTYPPELNQQASFTALLLDITLATG